MRILYLTNGQSPHDLRFTRALERTQHEIIVLSLDGITTGWPAKVTPVPWEPVEKNWKRIRLQASKLKSLLDDLKPDMVHAGPVQGPAFQAAVAGFHPLVTMSWGSDLLLEAGRNFQTKRMTRFTLSRTDALVGDSKCIEEKARHYSFKGPYFKFPWGVDLQHFTPAGPANLRTKLGWQNKTVSLSMRSFETLYDVKSIVHAFFQASNLRQDLRLMVFGQGTQETLLKEIVAVGGFEEKVYFGGRASLEELPDIYRSADLYISASHSDGASVSLMEALACGLPALVSDIPGNREWIETGKNGWLFKTGSLKELSKYLREFDKESGDTLVMKSTNRLLAEERADWSKNFPVLLNAYEKAFEIHRGQA
jgi:glycosyltransferase involved in cell wall biosynthesis